MPPEGVRTYQIDIPGAADLFHFIIPSLNDPNLKRERIQRMLTHTSPVPETLQWIPDLITNIDDAQDLLTTALWLGKPLIKKLPSRWIPLVGWAMTINDIANLCTTLLGLAMTPGLTKPDFHKYAKGTRFKRKYSQAEVDRWMRPGGWKTQLGNFLQAAQAADTVTGVGLTLGSVMGFASDLIWAPYRIAQGHKIEIRLPPEGDPLTKAYRYMTHSPKQLYAQEVLSPEDHALLLAAQSIASDMILTSGVPINEGRAEEARWEWIPNYIPWEPSSRQALEENGFDLSRTDYYKPYIGQTTRKLYNVHYDSRLNFSRYNRALRRELGEGPEGNIFWMVGRESALNSLELAQFGTEDDIYEYSPEQRATLQINELNFKVDTYPSQVTPWHFLTAITSAHTNLPANKLTLEQVQSIAETLGITYSRKYSN